MKALLIVAHGSRQGPFNQEILTLVKTLEEQVRGDFDRVRGAFIQFAEPAFEDQVADLAQAGVTRVVVLPYFTAAGSHVSEDIPRLVAAARRTFPRVTFDITDHLGRLPGIQEVIISAARGRF